MIKNFIVAVLILGCAVAPAAFDDSFVNEFTGRQNIRHLDTNVQMEAIAGSMVGKRLTYEELIS